MNYRFKLASAQNTALTKVTLEGEFTLAGLEAGCGLECHFVMGGCSPACLQGCHPWNSVAGTIHVDTFHQVPLGPLAAQRISPFLFPFHTTRDSFPACIICGSLEDHSTVLRRKAGPDRRQSLFSLFRSTEGLLVTGQLDVLLPHLEYCRDLMSTGLSFCCCVVVKSCLTLL